MLLDQRGGTVIQMNILSTNICAKRVPVKLVKVTRVLGRTGTIPTIPKERRRYGER